jgi:hypothetical protein
MSIEQALCDILINDATVGTLVSTRVYFMRIPQNTDRPNILLHKFAAEGSPTLSGRGGLKTGHFSVDCFAGSFADVRKLADAVYSAFDQYRGVVSGMNVQHILATPPVDIPEDEPLDPEIFRRNVVVEVLYQE